MAIVIGKRFLLTPLAAGLAALLASAPTDATVVQPSHTRAFAQVAKASSGSFVRASRLSQEHIQAFRGKRPLKHPRAGHALAAHAPSGAKVAVTACDEAALRSAIAGVGDGDTVDLTDLRNCTITLTDGALHVAVDNLTLSGPSDNSLVLDGGNIDSVLYHSGYGELTIDHLSIQHGYYSGYGYFALGGCIYSVADVALTNSTVSGCTVGSDMPYVSSGAGVAAMGNLTLSKSIISQNYAYGYARAFGGGAYSSYGVIKSDDSTISDNVAYGYYYGGYGGGLAGFSDIQVTNSTISGNASSAQGGGVYSGGGYLTVDNSRIISNTTGLAGGGVLSQVQSVITRSTISGNEAAFGAGVSNAGSARIADTTISGNTAYYSGGGIYSFGDLAVSNSTISGNATMNGTPYEGYYGTGLRGGAGIFSTRANLTVENSTVAFNDATTDYGGGGIFLSDYGIGDPTAYNSHIVSTIVSNNSATSGAGDVGADVAGFVIDGDHNLFVDADAANVTVPDGTLTDDPNLQALADNGGPTWTHALGDGSAAIDVGDNPDGLDFDQRGAGFDRVVGDAADIGAFEYGATNDAIFKDGFDAAPPPP